MIAILLLLALGQPAAVSGVVVDTTGAPISGVVVTITAGDAKQTVRTQADGSWTLPEPSASTITIRVDVPGFAPIDRAVKLPSPPLRFELRPESVSEHVTVSGDASAPRLAIDSSVTTMNAAAIASSPALHLDDQLRSVPGFSLFRRTTSAVANPTTQGVTLRGLSASGSSRTLVLADDVPLNDPFGGWVYWDRVPMAALDRVDVARGASGDLHGNDALGGVIRLTTRTSRGAEAWLDGGTLGTARGSGYAAASGRNVSGGVAVERATTDGFVVIAPEARGPIDVPATSDSTSATAWGAATSGAFQATLRGGYFNEARGNGTPAQVNGTVTRWGAANAHGTLAGGLWDARGDLSFTNYRQTFSSVSADRTSERLTALQWVGSTGADAGASWVRQMSRLQLIASGSMRSMRANLDEASIAVTGVESAITRTPPKQIGAGFVLEGKYDVSSRVTIDAGARVEHWTLSRRDTAGGTQHFTFVDPRVEAAIRFGDDKDLRVSWLTGFRTPTMNELYRSFRVGSTNTLANNQLQPEKSKGPEAAFTIRRERWTARAIAYETTLDGAIFNHTISSSPTAILRQRENGGARTIGSELELEWRAAPALSLTTSWALNDAKMTSGELDGKRVAQVPRAAGSIGARTSVEHFSASAGIRVIGAQFDDDINQFKLNAGSLADARASWRLSRRAELFGAIENVFDQDIDTGRTPIRTIGNPRISRAGLTVRW